VAAKGRELAFDYRRTYKCRSAPGTPEPRKTAYCGGFAPGLDRDDSGRMAQLYHELAIVGRQETASRRHSDQCVCAMNCRQKVSGIRLRRHAIDPLAALDSLVCWYAFRVRAYAHPLLTLGMSQEDRCFSQVPELPL
jgi:hypothetical protein